MTPVERAAAVIEEIIENAILRHSPASRINGLDEYSGRILQALSDAGMLAEGWRPIETAPKDGRFLVFGGTWRGDWSGENQSPRAVMIDRDDAAFSVADTEYYGPEIVAPTHWRPLPTPPAEE